MALLGRRVMCVEWDPRAVRLLVARVGRGSIALEDAHAHLIPDDVNPEDPRSMGELIKKLAQEHHLKVSRAVVDVPRDKAVISRVAIPPTPQDELAAVVRFQGMRELPFSAEDAVVDFVVIDRNEKGLATEVMLAATRKSTIDRLRETCRVAGLSAIRIGLRPFANLVSVQQFSELAGKRLLFIDVGAAVTEIDIFEGDAVAVSHATNLVIPTQVSDGAGATDSDADDASPSAATTDDDGDTSGSAAGDEERDWLRAATNQVTRAQLDPRAAAVQDLTVEITRRLQAYRALDPNAGVDHILVAGATGVEPQLATALHERFSLPASLFDPTDPLGLVAEDGAKLRGFASPLGLAWGLSREGLLELDFLNPKREIPRAEKIKRRARIGTMAALTVATAVLAFGAREWIQLQRERDALESSVKKLERDFDKMREIEIFAERGEELRDHPPVWLHHFVTLTETMLAPDPKNEERLRAGISTVVERLEFDTKDGTIDARVVARQYEDVARIEDALHEMSDEDGDAIYRVRGYEWIGQSDIPTFGGNTKITIEVRDAQRQIDDIAKAESDRRKELRKRR